MVQFLLQSLLAFPWPVMSLTSNLVLYWLLCHVPDFVGSDFGLVGLVLMYCAGVALTFEKLCIANAQHGKKCVSSPAAKATISTDLPKIDKHENTNV